MSDKDQPQSSTEAPNPDLSELFSRNPLELSRDPAALNALIEGLRAQRKAFVASGAKSKPQTKTASKARGAGLAAQINIDL